MKKFLSLLLAVVLTFSLVSCGKDADQPQSSSENSSVTQDTEDAVLEDIDITFKDTVKGYITHTSGGEYTVTEDEAYESSGDFYVFLPEGTVFSCDKEFYFFGYTNTEGFSLNPWIMRNSGFTVETFTPDWATGDFTLSKDCFVRFSVKGSLSDIKMSVPEGKSSLVLAGSKEEMQIAPILSEMNDYFAELEGSVNYIFITDLHNGSFVNDPDNDGLRNYDSVETVNSRLKSKTAILTDAVNYVNLCPSMDFIVIGGDIINGYETEESLTYQDAKKKNPSLTVKEHVIDQLQDILAPLKKCEKPVFVLAGNHDYNDGHTLWLNTNHPENNAKRADYILSDLDWEKGVFSQFVNVKVVRDPEYSYGGSSISKYYYYDLEKQGKTTRIICLDIKDGRQPFDDNGNVLGNPSANSGYCYSDAQMKWLAEVALKGDFDNAMVFAHSGMSEGTTKMEKILAAYQSRSSYSSGGAAKIDASYMGRASGDITLYHHGHEHEEFYNYGSALRFWTFCSNPVTIDIYSATESSVYKYSTKGEHKEFTRDGKQR